MKKIILLYFLLLSVSCGKQILEEPYQPKEIVFFETEGYLWEYTETESFWSLGRDVEFDSKRKRFSMHILGESSVLSPDSNGIHLFLVFDSIQQAQDFKLSNLRHVEVESFIDDKQVPTYEDIHSFEFNASHFDPEHNFDKTRSDYGSIKANFSLKLVNQFDDTITVRNGLIDYEFFTGYD